MNTADNIPSPQPTRILLLGATLDSENRGIGALAMGALCILLRRYENCSIQFLDYASEPSTKRVEIEGRPVDVPLLNIRFSKRLLLPNNVALLIALALAVRLSNGALRNVIADRNRYMKEILSADVAVAVSGGDSFSDIYGMGRFFYMALPQLLLLILHKPLVLLPQTIGPMQSRTARWIAGYIIRHARMTYSRELQEPSASDAGAFEVSVSGQIRFAYDMGFILEPKKPANNLVFDFQNRSSARLLVGLNVSGLLSMGGYSGKNMFALRYNYDQLVERVIEFIIETKDADVLLVPHVFGADAESDCLAIHSVYERLHRKYSGRLFRVIGDYDQNEIKYVIGLCDLFVGSRMHACIAALSQSIPAVGIAYSQKFAGVLQSIGVGSLVADPRLADIEDVLLMIDTTFSRRTEIGALLKIKMPEVKGGVYNVLADIQ